MLILTNLVFIYIDFFPPILLFSKLFSNFLECLKMVYIKIHPQFI